MRFRLEVEVDVQCPPEFLNLENKLMEGELNQKT